MHPTPWTPPRRWWTAVAGLAGLAAAGALAQCTAPEPFHPAPLPPEVSDLAVGFLGAGSTEPALAELSDDDLAELVEILGRLIAAYERRDFDSYLALRAGDLDFAERVQAPRVEELHGFCRELGVAPEDFAPGWIGALGDYWSAYYAQAPVTRFRPEETVVELHREGLRTRSLEAWDAAFEARCAAQKGFRLDHNAMVPHRRSIEQVAHDAGPLRWIDLELGYDAHDAVSGRLLARFVWDARVGEWFLHRATTVLDGEPREDRRFLVL